MTRVRSFLNAAALVGVLALPGTSHALFHFAWIDEFMTSYDGDPNVQFVEMFMLGIGQNLVLNSVLAAFDPNGEHLADLLIVPSNVLAGGGRSWIVGTAQFETVSGLTVDFIMPAGLRTGGGMVCWGAPGLAVPDPNTWDHTDPSQYVDCVAYGTYSGPSNIHIGTPTPLDADGHSLARKEVADNNNNLIDFICADPAVPENNDFETAEMVATTACPAVCGDDVTEGAEECDGSDDGACGGGLCELDCTCGEPPPPPPLEGIPTLPQAALIALLGGLLAAGGLRSRERASAVVRRD